MKTRSVKLYNGARFEVPRGLQRIDTRSTHGWQVRYQGTKFFSDHGPDKTHSTAAFVDALKELAQRMSTLPVPLSLKRGPSAHKSSDLPPGISGPILRPRRGSEVKNVVLAVLLPRFGQTPRLRSIYLGSAQTTTKKRFNEALKEAKALRAEALAIYEEAALKVRRAEARVLRDQAKALVAAKPKV
jgi:hypothetical protein